MKNISFLLLGVLFGIIMFKSEAASWFRIYEMFQFKALHMYGIIGSALAIGVTGVYFIREFDIKSFGGKKIVFQDKESAYTRAILGGIIFGLGWALAGLCPGPMFTMMGAGFLPVIIVFVATLFGTFVYGAVKNKLPH